MWSLQRKTKARTGGDGTEGKRRERDKTGTGREGEDGTGREKRGKKREGIEKAGTGRVPMYQSMIETKPLLCLQVGSKE